MDSGIIISASHNPGDYNGLKLVGEKSVPISGETGIYAMEELLKSVNKVEKNNGTIKKMNVFDDYILHSLKYVDENKLKKFRIVIDSANGMGGPMAKAFFKHLKQEVIFINNELDGTFPNHEANPLVLENFLQLKEAILAKKADLGIMFDGDADRCVFVDEKGNVISSDMIVALVSKTILSERKNCKIYYDVRSSRAVKEIIEENGGKAIRCQVGHSLIKKQMRDENGIFGGELSGHYYLADEHYAECPLFVIIKVLEQLSIQNIALSKMITPIKKYFHSGEINSKVSDKKQMMENMAEKYKDGNVTWLDGLSVDYDDWWFNIRPSNTEPYLRLNVEGKTEKLMQTKKEQLLKEIRK